MEEKFLKALESEKLVKASNNSISEALRYCMLKVGMRSNNLPDEVESVILYNHLVGFYGKLTVEEIKLAFDLAVTGKIDAPETFENFSCTYVSKVLNAYKVWADDKFYKQQAPNENLITKQNIESNWRESVQTALNNFYNGNYQYRLWVSEMYDQLVIDDFIPALYYKDFMQDARRFFCEKLHLEIIQVEKKIVHAKNGKFLNTHKNLQNQLIEYRSGNKDKDVILLSKQTAILKYFEYLKGKGIEKIYVQS